MSLEDALTLKKGDTVTIRKDLGSYRREDFIVRLDSHEKMQSHAGKTVTILNVRTSGPGRFWLNEQGDSSDQWVWSYDTLEPLNGGWL